MLTEQIMETTEARLGIGDEWRCLIDLVDADLGHVAEAIAEEVVEAMCRDMRHEPHTNGCTDESGTLTIGGQVWQYRR